MSTSVTLKYFSLINLMCTPLLFAVPVSAFAQSEPELDEIIVTATKRAQSPQDIGASLSVLLKDTLGSAGFDGAEDIAQRLSGVQAVIGGGSRVGFQIRGIGAVDHQALTPTAASAYVDGVYLATNAQTGHLLFDLERVEVLKGPQGSLYGRNASAGAINFVSAKPEDNFGGYMHVEAGNAERFNVLGAVNLPFDDNFSLRVAGRYLSQGPTIENVATLAAPAPEDAGGRRDEFGVRVQGAWTVSQATSVLVSVHYGEDNGVNAAPLNDALSLQKHQISIGADGVQDTDNEFYGAAIDITHEWGAFSLYSQTAFEGYNQQYGFDFDGTQAPFGDASLNANLAYDRDFSQWSEEVRLSYRGDGLNLMGGVYLSDDDFSQDYLIWCGELNRQTLLGTCRYVGAPGRTGSNPASLGVASSLLSTINQTRQTAALFSYNDFSLTPRLDLVVGARFTHETIKGSGQGIHIFDDGVRALNNRDDLGAAIGSNTLTENRFSGNIGLNFKANDSTLLYLAYTNGYKSGGFNGEVINNATHFQDEGLFEAETVNALETGIKLDLGATFQLSTDVFYQFYAKPQARIFVPFSTANGGSFTSNSLANLDKASSYGLEMQAAWMPISALKLNAGLTLLDTEIKQVFDPNTPDNFTDFDGNPLPFASRFSANLGARYTHHHSANVDVVFDVAGKYQSAFYLDAEGLEDRKQDGYGLVDGRLALQFKRQGVEVAFWGKNLGNADYAVAGFGFIGYNRFLGAPRTYGFSVRYSY